MKKMKLILTLYFLFFSYSVQAFEFKGVMLGSPPSSVYGSFNDAFCNDAKTEKSKTYNDHSCMVFKSTVAGIPTALGFYYFDNKLWKISTFELKSSGHNELKAALIRKYGKPTVEKNTTVSNAMGAKFKNVETEWVTDEYKMVLIKYNGKISESSLNIYSSNGMKEFVLRMKAYKKGAVNDL